MKLCEKRMHKAKGDSNEYSIISQQHCILSSANSPRPSGTKIEWSELKKIGSGPKIKWSEKKVFYSIQRSYVLDSFYHVVSQITRVSIIGVPLHMIFCSRFVGYT